MPAVSPTYHAATSAVDDVQAQQRAQAAAKGTLVLSVRVTSSERRRVAEAAMGEAGATRIGGVTRTTADVNLASDANAQPLVDSAAWTG